MANIMKNFKRLITLALKDGKITEKEIIIDLSLEIVYIS